MLGFEPIANVPLSAWALDPGTTEPSAVAITVEDGTCVTGANSYGSATEADEYLSNKANATTWFTLTATQKDQALIESTLMMESVVKWSCGSASCVGGLSWPRTGGKYPNGTTVPAGTVPTFVKNAQFELAMQAMAADIWGFISASSDKYSKVSLGRGALEVEYNLDAQATQDFVTRIPSWWWSMLGGCASPRSSVPGSVGIALVHR